MHMHDEGERLTTFFDTVYRSDPRGRSFAELRDVEYYQPRIDTELRDGNEIYFVRETHAYFDDQKKRPANITYTLNPENGEEAFSSWEAAEARYKAQLSSRAKEGFIHLFSFDPFSPDGVSYRMLDPNEPL